MTQPDTIAEGWQDIASAPKDGRWFVAKTKDGIGFSGQDYPPAVIRVTGQRYDWEICGPGDDWDVEAKALNSGSGGWKLTDFALWLDLPPLSNPPASTQAE